MTETLARPAAAPAVEPAGRPPIVAGALAALVAVAAGLLLVVLVVVGGWAADGRSAGGVGTAVRAGARVWLVAHGTALDLPTGRYALAPLGLTVLPLVLLWRAGRAVSRGLGASSVRAAVRAALVVVVPYAALTGAVALVTGTGPVRPSAVSALLAGAVVALLGAGAGALRPERLWRAAWLALGPRAGRTLPAAATALGTLLAGGALLAGGSLAVHGSRAAELFGATAPGPVGGLALLLLGLAHLPNAVVWGACWLAGPGFAVGVGTAVGPFGHELGAVPALPLLAALPSAGAPGWAAGLALLVPLGAGALAGRVLHRAADTRSRTGVAVDLLLTALWTGAAVAALAVASGGAAGGQRLQAVGPSAGWCGLAVAAEVAAAGLVTLLVLRRRR